MSDFESRREERRRWRDERREERRKWMEERWGDKGSRGYYAVHAKGSIWTGVFILLVGVAALLKASLPDIPGWVFSWPSFLIALGFFIGLRHNFEGATWFILMLVGGIFLYDHINPDFSFRRYIWPMALIALGLFFIVRPRRRNWVHLYEAKKKEGIQDNNPPVNEGKWSTEDFVDSTSIFGGAKKNIISKSFKGGDLVNIFGGTDLDLSQADFTGTAVIELTTIFGGTKLIVPSNWSVKSEAVIIFGGIEDKRKMMAVTESADKVLLLKGTVIFGGIEIKSY
ncbi:MAG: LiaF-related protein [Bacteroidota bacterium]|nr:LiaF-related protein [Bacteroidota bacterium]